MEVTINIKMIGLEGETIEKTSKFLDAIKNFDCKVIINIDSLPGTAGKLN